MTFFISFTIILNETFSLVTFLTIRKDYTTHLALKINL